MAIGPAESSSGFIELCIPVAKKISHAKSPALEFDRILYNSIKNPIRYKPINHGVF